MEFKLPAVEKIKTNYIFYGSHLFFFPLLDDFLLTSASVNPSVPLFLFPDLIHKKKYHLIPRHPMGLCPKVPQPNKKVLLSPLYKVQFRELGAQI